MMKLFKSTLISCSIIAFLAACGVQETSLESPQKTAETAAESVATAKAGSPNIVFILVDDMGYGQLGVTGHPIIKTPHLDKLANNGILFTEAYAGSTVCSPSRISLMTGKDSAKLHSNANTILLRPEDRTMAHMLKRAGYKTALFGKFGIGTTFGKTDPMTMGFQTWYGLLHNITAHRQYPTMIFEDNEMKFVLPNVAGAEGAYAQELFTDKAVEFIGEQSKDTPFFAFISYTSPHAELAAPEEFIAPYKDKFPADDYPGLSDPDNKPKFADYYPKPVPMATATQAGMIAALDAYVGEIMAALAVKDLADNTIVFFTSDNGPHAEGGADPIAIQASNPFRGGKRDLYDGGIHVPMIVHWPAKIKGGRVDDTPWAFADVLPTLAEITNAGPSAMRGLDPNGASILPVLLDPEAELGERMLYWEFSKQLGDPNSGITGTVTQAARRGKWKAVRLTEDSALELYDIEIDRAELNNIADQHPEITAEFVAKFDALLAD